MHDAVGVGPDLAYFAASGALVGRFAAVGNVRVGGILAEVRRLAFPPMLVEITCTAVA